MRRAFGLVFTLLLVIPCAAQAASIDRPSRRPPPAVSRCGRHIVEVVAGAVRLDGVSLTQSRGQVEIAVAPSWRRGCGAVAWVERHGAERRLIVVPSIGAGAPSLLLSWPLPSTTGVERIFWIGRSRVTVGIAMLQPSAIASWS